MLKPLTLQFPAAALRMIARVLKLAQEYPSLLFNAADDRRPRCEGFVHFAELLHRGRAPSCGMI